MFKFYLKVAFRNIWKYKIQSLIGILGLAFALACFVPALYWMHFEKTYDSFYPDSNRIFRIYSVEKESGKVNEQLPGLLGSELIKHFPVLEASVGFAMEQLDYQTESRDYIQLNTICVDSAFFQVFPQVQVYGDMRQALQSAGNIVLTETVALRLFGNVENAIGQKLEHFLSKIFGSCTVTAVIKDLPTNTNLPFDVICNFPALQDASMIMPTSAQWEYYNNCIYVKLHPQTNINELATQLRDFTSNINTNSNIQLRILPLKDVRNQLNADLPFSLNFIRLLVAAGILLMLSALFNFLNLYIGIFHQRINEFRQRLIYGATSRQLILQMMFELTCAILLALFIACFFIFLTRSFCSNLLGIAMPVSILLRFFLLSGLGMIVSVLLLSLIPCLRLNRLITNDLSKRKTTSQPILQHIAISFQLAVSIVFIVSALVIIKQMDFIKQKDLGFAKSGVIQLYSSSMQLGQYSAVLRQQLESIPQIINISATVFEPEKNINAQSMTITQVEWAQKQANRKPIFQLLFVDSNFAETFRLKLLAGRWLNDGENESQKIILNEEAVRIMELSEPVGTIIRMDPSMISSDGVASMQEYEVIGVVNDFHSHSLRSRIHPTIIRTCDLANIWYIRVMPGQEQEMMQQISATLANMDVSLTDVRLTLLEEVYDRLNYSEQIGLKLFSILAIVCLSISLFGIYAIATAATQRRRKEIAIRKILGADIKNIVRMFFREYILLVIIAGIVALPLAYLAMSFWLQGYAYHTNIPWWLLAGVIIVVIVAVLLTVLEQVQKAANSNPAEVVKSE
jgi:ABC-type transport system, involved in lipoprotein release, permease component